MKETEDIPAFCDIVKGKTVCFCPVWAKRCNKQCEKTILSRDLFRGWKDTMNRNKYGQSKG